MAFIKKHIRLVAFLLLIGVTGYQIYSFLSDDDWSGALGKWAGRGGVLAFAAVLVFFDIVLDYLGWLWVYARFKVRAWDRVGIAAYLSAHAALFLPMQLGRLVRPDALARLGRATLQTGIQAEAVTFYLDLVAVGVVLAGSACWLYYPLLVPLVILLVSAGGAFVADRAAVLISGTSLALPPSFWWRWETFCIIQLRALTWVLHGLVLYVLIRDLPGKIGALPVVFSTVLSTVAASGTGLPGGIGAIEGFLGELMRRMEVPAAHTTVATNVFRLMTFWVLLPIGWVCLTYVNRVVARTTGAVQEDEEG